MEYVAVFFLWAVLHSASMSRPAKRWASRLLGENFRYYRLGFTFLAVASFAAAMAAAPRLDQVVYQVGGLAAIPLWIVRLAGVGFFLWTCALVDLGTFAGLRQAFGPDPGALAPDGEPAAGRRLITAGPYGIVRHPMYTAGILILCAEPRMTVEKLLFAVCATAYFAVGSVFEERRLIDVFGQAYRDYQASTPRLIPRFGRQSPS